MSRYQSIKNVSAGILPLIALAALSTVGFAQTVKVHGMIKARSGATMTVQTPDSTTVIVLLTDNTKVGQIEGVLKVRRKDMSMAALIPGLEVQVEGTYNGLNQVEASLVKFQGNDLERAQSIQAGVHQTEVQAQRNREDLERQTAELKAQAEALKAEQERVSANREAIDANKAKIDANKAKIDANRIKIEAAIERFGQLDEYYILDEATVLFANGKVVVDPQYTAQLQQLAQKAKTIEGYMIQVEGYASSVGSPVLNQKLSEDRAANVTHILIQKGSIPLTNVLAPGAMGESRQVADNKTAEGQAQNRRVVVRVLQNKGIAGLQSLK